LLEVINLPAVRGKPVTFWLYPTHDEARNAQLLQTQLEARAQPLLQATAGLPVKIYSLARHSKWRDVQYTDAIHPTVDGIRTMAQIMTSAERASMQIPAPPVE